MILEITLGRDDELQCCSKRHEARGALAREIWAWIALWGHLFDLVTGQPMTFFLVLGSRSSPPSPPSSRIVCERSSYRLC